MAVRTSKKGTRRKTKEPTAQSRAQTSPQRAGSSAPSTAAAPKSESVKADVLWEVLLESGWFPYDADCSAALTKAAKHGTNSVQLHIGENDYEVQIPSAEGLGAADGEQKNLFSGTIRMVRRRPKVMPECAEECNQFWDRKLCNPALSVSDDLLTVQSDHVENDSGETRAAIGDAVFETGPHRLVIVYNGGYLPFLCAGVAHVDDPAMTGPEGTLVNGYSRSQGNSCKKGAWLYSYYYNAFSEDGDDWYRSPTKAEVEWEPGDELHVELLPAGRLRFFYGRPGDEPIFLGDTARPVPGRCRVYALLGGEAQSLSLRGGLLPPWIKKQDLRRPKQSRALLTILEDTARRGISLRQMQALGELVKEAVSKYEIMGFDRAPLRWESLTMYDVCTHFVKPVTRAATCSFVQHIAGGCQAPTWMISHAWSTPFASTLRMLALHASSRHCQDPLSTLYWCCTMANNQHDLAELNEDDLLLSPFARVLRSEDCVGTVLLCDSNVTPLRRVWCTFEMHLSEALRSGRMDAKPRHLLDVAACVSSLPGQDSLKTTEGAAMLQDAYGGHWQEYSELPDVFFPLEVARVGTTVDIAKATASMAQDRHAILNYVASGKALRSEPPEADLSYDTLNTFIHSIFASAELYRLACERPAGCVEQAKQLLANRADPNKFVRGGNTALFAAAGADPAVPAAGNDAKPMLELLLSSRADPNLVNSRGRTVLESSGLAGELSSLLRSYGALPFKDVADSHERRVNSALDAIMSQGFAAEAAAFGGSGGGGSGTKLLSPALRSVEEASAMLKRYPAATCHINALATKMDRQRRRAKVIERALQAAGCTNPMEAHTVDRGPILRLALSFPGSGALEID